MKKKPTPEKTAAGPWQYARFVLLFAVVAGFLGGLIWAGRWGLDQLRGRDRYDVAFADIECEAPVGMDKRQFLDEVRYPNRLPPQLHLLDGDLEAKLRAEFALHAWIEKVDDVKIVPPKRIVVKLTHRVPVLAVKVGDTLRAVDGAGVLLPRNAPTRELPVYDGEAKAPGNDGARFGDPNVELAARKLKS